MKQRVNQLLSVVLMMPRPAMTQNHSLCSRPVGLWFALLHFVMFRLNAASERRQFPETFRRADAASWEKACAFLSWRLGWSPPQTVSCVSFTLLTSLHNLRTAPPPIKIWMFDRSWNMCRCSGWVPACWHLPSLTCSNKSSCSKIAIRLKVLRPDDVVKCALPVAVAPIEDLIPLQEGKTLDCPDLQDATKMSESAPKVQWYFVAHPVSFQHCC